METETALALINQSRNLKFTSAWLQHYLGAGGYTVKISELENPVPRFERGYISNTRGQWAYNVPVEVEFKNDEGEKEKGTVFVMAMADGSVLADY